MRKAVGVLVLLGLLAVGAFVFRGRLFPDNTPELDPKVLTDESEQDVVGQFKIDIPEGADRAYLSPVNRSDGVGVVVKSNNTITILADLPDPPAGHSYQAWLERGREGDAEHEVVSLGRLSVAKGGWLLEVDRGVEGFDRFLVTLEARFDATPEARVLEGKSSF